MTQLLAVMSGELCVRLRDLCVRIYVDFSQHHFNTEHVEQDAEFTKNQLEPYFFRLAQLSNGPDTSEIWR